MRCHSTAPMQELAFLYVPPGVLPEARFLTKKEIGIFLDPIPYTGKGPKLMIEAVFL